ncbi:DNA-binding protein [Aliidiomarina celeris]|uniref:DNA-binding protein n=1 Tax=Aliidiomarina celeris TaxID=2249428 RepID=UPI000DE9DD56|nr:DNA-binding protein [Aliidiomarina celeris]
MTGKQYLPENQNDFLIFSAEDGRVQIQCRFEGEIVWLPQAALAELYQLIPQAIRQHVRSVYEDVELDERSTCKDYLQVRNESNREVKH